MIESRTSGSAPNPFAFLGDPQAVASAIEHARRWQLKSRVCRPLDRPSRARLSKELAQFDAMIEAEARGQRPA
jgi:hypothetical protein